MFIDSEFESAASYAVELLKGDYDDSKQVSGMIEKMKLFLAHVNQGALLAAYNAYSDEIAYQFGQDFGAYIAGGLPLSQRDYFDNGSGLIESLRKAEAIEPVALRLRPVVDWICDIYRPELSGMTATQRDQIACDIEKALEYHAELALFLDSLDSCGVKSATKSLLQDDCYTLNIVFDGTKIEIAY